MALIKSTEHLKQFIDVENATYKKSFEPYIKQAENDFIKAILGDKVYEDLNTAYNQNTILASHWLELWENVNIANVNLAWYLYFPIVNIRKSDAGLTTSQSQDSERVTKWMYDEGRIALKVAGYKGIDNLLDYLEKSTAKPWYNDWQAGSGFADYKKYFVNSAKVASNFIPIANSRWIFQLLIPYINTCQTLVIEPEIGNSFFADLLLKFKNANGGTEEKKAIEMIQAIIALYCYGEAYKDANFRRELAIINGTRFDGTESNSKQAKDEHIVAERISDDYMSKANALLGKLMAYLNSTATDSLFELYFNSDKYVSTSGDVDTTQGDNDNAKGTFFWM